MRYKVFDVEILHTVESVGGWDNTDKMGICCAVVYDSAVNSFRVWGDGDEIKIIADLVDCDLVVGFNHIDFDWRVLQHIPKSVDVWATPALVEIPQYDMMREAKTAAHADKYEKGWKLNDLAWSTLRRRKRMSGTIAPVLWAAGEYTRVIDYCIDDVALTRDLFSRCMNEGWILHPITEERVAMPSPKDRMRWREGKP